jgi:hypothetical protein
LGERAVVWLLVLPLINYVTSGKLLNSSSPVSSPVMWLFLWVTLKIKWDNQYEMLNP